MTFNYVSNFLLLDPPPPHLIPPLNPLPPLPSPPLITPATPPSPTNLVEKESEEEDDIVVECRGQKWKKEMDRTKLKPVPFRQWWLKTIFGDYVFQDHLLLKWWHDLTYSLICSQEINWTSLLRWKNVELRRTISSNLYMVDYIYFLVF